MIIKKTKNMTDSERIAVDNSNNQYLKALAYAPVGMIIPFAGATAPDTFLICDGSALDTTEYIDLFGVIGYAYGGSGDTFNLPDLRGKKIADISTIFIIKSANAISQDVKIMVQAYADDTYNANSENAQSGKAVAEAFNNYFNTNSLNVFDGKIKENTSVNQTTGVETTTNGFSVVENYIDLKGNDKITCSSTFQFLALYDENKDFKKRQEVSPTGEYGVYDVRDCDCAYVRPIARMSNYASAGITAFDVNTAYVVLGEYTGGYVPYTPPKLKRELLDMQYISGEVASDIEQGFGERVAEIESCFNEASKNVFNPDARDIGWSTDANGTPVTGDSYSKLGLGEYIELKGNTSIVFSKAFLNVAFYDVGQTPIIRKTITHTDPYASAIFTGIPTNAVYFRPITTETRYTEGEEYILLGSEDTGYEPYHPKQVKNENLDIDGISEQVIKNINTLGKTIIAFGDSIVWGYGNGNTEGSGYTDIYAKNKGCTSVNCAESGATISNKVSAGRSWIYDQITENISQQADLCVIGGMTNDCNYVNEEGFIGAISSNYTNFDTNTFYGALEQILSKCKETWKNVVFVLPHNMSSRGATAQKTLRDIVLEVCEKWSVEVVDLYANCGLNTNIEFMYNNYTSNPTNKPDGTHPNGEGYNKFYLPQVTPVFDKYLNN